MGKARWHPKLFVVVLHKVHIQAGDLLEVLLVEAFKKEAPRITKDLGLENEQVGDVAGDDGVGHWGSSFKLGSPQICVDVRPWLH
jgi:hypothetical protein